MLNIIDRYVLKQITMPLVASLAIGLSMLLAERLVRLLDVTLGKKNSFGVVFEMLAYLVPHYLGTAVPAALFLGLLFGFNKLSKNSEIDAMTSVGIGLHQLVRPAMLLALLFSAASLGVFGWLQPLTRYAYRAVLFDVKNVDAFYLAEEGVFMQSGTRTFILDKLDRSKNTFEHVFIFDYDGPNGATTLAASNGVLVPVPGQLRPVLQLKDGHQVKLERWPTLDPDKPPVIASIATFAETNTPLGRVAKDIFRKRGDDERELTLPEIYHALDTPPAGSTPDAMRSELHRRIINIIAMLVLPFLAIPFAIGRTRSPRAYRMIIALTLLIAFHEIIEQGALLAKTGKLSPWLSMWLPLALLSAFAAWRFHAAAFHIAGEGLEKILVPMQERIDRVIAVFRRTREAKP